MRQMLAFDIGGTRMRGGLYDEERHLLAERNGPGANPVLVGIEGCIDAVLSLGRRVLEEKPGELETVACGVAGAESCGSGKAIAERLLQGLQAKRVLVTDDMMPVIYANVGAGPAVAVIAGTGSSVKAQAADGTWLVLSGRGTVFGDDGSAHQLAVAGLRAAAEAVDGVGAPTRLVSDLPRAAGVNEFGNLVAWTNAATKGEVAALAKAVTAAADAGDRVAEQCVRSQAGKLARRTAAAFARLHLPEDTPLLLNGGLFEECGRYLQAYNNALRGMLPGVEPRLASLRGHRAVLELAVAERLPGGFPVAVAKRQPSQA